MHFNIINEPLLEIFKDFGNEFTIQILDTFMHKTKVLTKGIEFAFDQQDFQEVRSIANELQTISNNLGFFKFSSHCAAIERSIKINKVRELPFLIINISEEAKLLEMTLCEIKSVIGRR